MRYTNIVFLSVLLVGCSGSEASTPTLQPPPAPPANLAPTAIATAPASVSEGQTVTLSSNQSDDPDGEIATFAWQQLSGPDVPLLDADSATASFDAPLVSAPTVLTFELAVTDADGDVATTTVDTTITVAPSSTIVEIETDFDDVARAFSVYTPANYEAGSPAIVLLHGGAGSMRQVLEPQATTSGWIDFAEAAGFLLIVPNGYNETLMDGLGDQQSWNDIRTDLSGRTSLQDDTGFILETLDTIEAARAFDPDRVFVTGSSNGGIMTLGLLIETPERFFGGASFIAALPEEIVPDPLSPTPVMLLNGTDDQLVLFEGGPVSTDGAPTRSVPATIDYWLENNDANIAAAASRTLPNIDPADGCEIIETRYPSLLDNTTAVLVYDVQGGGHNIPDPDAGNFPPAAEALLGPRCRDADGIDLAFDFFQSLQQ